MSDKQAKLRQLDATYQRELELVRGVLEFSYISIKSLILVNGGAVIALLTFIGTIWSDEKLLIAQIFANLAFFVWGIICAVSTALFAYLFQAFLVEDDKIDTHPAIYLLRCIAVGCAFSSLILFSFGTFKIISAVSSYFH